jgi:AraC-like DNA-binding protein
VVSTRLKSRGRGVIGILAGVRYVSRVPQAPLDGLIDDLYYLEGASPYPKLLVPPMPSALLFITLDGPFRLHNGDPAGPPAQPAEGCFIGMPTRHMLIEYPQFTRIVGVHFKPWGAFPFLQISLHELRDQIVPTSTLWGRFADHVRERMHAAASPQDMLVTLEALLRRRLKASKGLGLVRHLGTRLADAHGAVSIGAMTDSAGVSATYLTGRFKEQIGVPPKILARIYRFARVVLEIDPTEPVDWGETAQRAGFYDQPHFNKEFLAFTGRTPTEYLRLRRRFLAENPGHVLDTSPVPAE